MGLFRAGISPRKAIKRDQNYFDPVLNIRAPCQLWVEGIRRKSDPALPDESICKRHANAPAPRWIR